MSSIQFLTAVIVFSIKLAAICSELKNDDKDLSSSSNFTLTAESYSKLLLARRREHTSLVQNLVKTKYELSYKMIDFAFEKIFEVTKLNNQTLNESGYNFTNLRFPTSDQKQQEAFTLLVENSCLFATLFLGLPDISLRILKNSKYFNWTIHMSWNCKFVSNFPHILDEPTSKVIEVMIQKLESEDFKAVTVFRNETYLKSQPKIKRKKVKKGPQLSGGITKTEL